ncbi:hypothetical protein RZS08_46390, partial [Arthrospira platensis SPKY1]|nr:hypothetical protein [Arthrospira platensis SPKY1]
FRSPEKSVHALEVYRAVVNHAAAHLVFGGDALDSEGLDALDRALVEAVEDARVEALACQRFPRMRESWLAFHEHPADPPRRAGDLIQRLMRAWLDPQHADAHPWVAEGVAALAAWPDLNDPQRSLQTGKALA